MRTWKRCSIGVSISTGYILSESLFSYLQVELGRKKHLGHNAVEASTESLARISPSLDGHVPTRRTTADEKNIELYSVSGRSRKKMRLFCSTGIGVLTLSKAISFCRHTKVSPHVVSYVMLSGRIFWYWLCKTLAWAWMEDGCSPRTLMGIERQREYTVYSYKPCGMCPCLNFWVTN